MQAGWAAGSHGQAMRAAGHRSHLSAVPPVVCTLLLTCTGVGHSSRASQPCSDDSRRVGLHRASKTTENVTHSFYHNCQTAGVHENKRIRRPITILRESKHFIPLRLFRLFFPQRAYCVFTSAQKTNFIQLCLKVCNVHGKVMPCTLSAIV